MTRRLLAFTLAIVPFVACSNGVPLGPSNPPETQAPAAVEPTPAAAAPTPTSAPPPTVAYTQDIAPIMASDCTVCHNDRSPAGRYSTAGYTQVMKAVRAGSASSSLVIVTRPGGHMYGFLSGDRVAKASLISQWVLTGATTSR